MNDKTNLTRRRLLPRFTLRVLLVFVTAVGIGLGYWTHLAREQARVVNRIQNSGGYVGYRFRGPLLQPQDSPIPAWIRNTVGIDFFHPVWIVHSGDPALIGDLARLSELEALVLYGDQLSDESLESVIQLRALRSLKISLDRAPEIRYQIANSPITDRTIGIACSLPNLEELEMFDCSYSREGIEALASAPKLRLIAVQGVPVAFREGDEELLSKSPTIEWARFGYWGEDGSDNCRIYSPEMQ